MTIQRIVIHGDPVLHSSTQPVADFGPELRELVADLFDTMYAGGGVGLAANQIGVDARVFVYDCPDADGGWRRGVIVNPVLSVSPPPRRAADPETDMEGCMSFPTDNGYPLVRSPWAVVAGFDAYGNAVEAAGSGVLARCFQHETDHLNGCLYVDRLSEEYASAAWQAAVDRGWTVPGNTWLPNTPEAGQAEAGRNAPLRRGDRRGPVSTEPLRIPAGAVFEPAGLCPASPQVRER